MKHRSFVIILAGAAGLAVVAPRTWLHPRTTPTPQANAPAPTLPVAPQRTAADTDQTATAHPAPIRPAPVTPFHWAQLESTNYLDYVSALHRVGCPPETIRQILRGELFSAMRGHDLAADEEIERLVNAIVGPYDPLSSSKPSLRRPGAIEAESNTVAISLAPPTQAMPSSPPKSGPSEPGGPFTAPTAGSSHNQTIQSASAPVTQTQFNPPTPAEPAGDGDSVFPPDRSALVHPDLFPSPEIISPIGNDSGTNRDAHPPDGDAPTDDDLSDIDDNGGGPQSRSDASLDGESGTITDGKSANDTLRIPRRALEKIAHRHSAPVSHVVAGWFLMNLADSGAPAEKSQLKSLVTELLDPAVIHDVEEISR